MRKKIAVVIACIGIGGLAGPGLADDACASLTAKLATLDLSKGTDLVDSQVGKTYQSLYADCDAHDLFNGQLLPKLKPSSADRLKCSTDPNRVAFIKKYSDGTVVIRAKMGVDADGSPVSKSPGASDADQPQTSLRYDGTDESINAEDVSFTVIPQARESFQAAFPADSGIGLGDLAVIVKGGRCSFGLVADMGPAYRIGEASMRAHEDLGNPQCKVAGEHPCTTLKAGGSGVGIGSGVTYILFPKSRPVPLASDTVSAVTAEQGAAKAASFLDAFQ
jgi:hypothetical protein